MRYRELRRVLEDIERASDRWRLHEAWWNSHPVDWVAIVDDADTGLWHELRTYVDLAAALPALPAGTPPRPHPWWDDRPPHDSGRLTWEDLLAVVDGVAAAYPRFKLAQLRRTERDDECYQVFAIEELPGVEDPRPFEFPYRTHWLDMVRDWVRLRAGAEGPADG